MLNVRFANYSTHFSKTIGKQTERTFALKMGQIQRFRFALLAEFVLIVSVHVQRATGNGLNRINCVL